MRYVIKDGKGRYFHRQRLDGKHEFYDLQRNALIFNDTALAEDWLKEKEFEGCRIVRLRPRKKRRPIADALTRLADTVGGMREEFSAAIEFGRQTVTERLVSAERCAAAFAGLATRVVSGFAPDLGEWRAARDAWAKHVAKYGEPAGKPE